MTHIAYREVIWQVELKPAGLGAIIALMKTYNSWVPGLRVAQAWKAEKGSAARRSMRFEAEMSTGWP